MKLHLVGGFLGSGKTTAIIAAARQLMAQKKKVGVITNDQGKYLVDTAFFRLGDVPVVEVTGGCFCCNYDDLEEQLDLLCTKIQPDVIFAESVGSCGDLVATVIKPLIEFSSQNIRPASFSVFTDSRLLQIRLDGEELPFSDSVVYLFDKQIEEAGLLVINKSDLLSKMDAEKVVALARMRYPDKVIKLQDSTNEDQIREWLSLVENDPIPLPEKSLEMDYQLYGEGEARLAWLDEKIVLTVLEDNGRKVVIQVVQAIIDELKRRSIPIGHLKFIIGADKTECKISITTMQVPDLEIAVPQFFGTQISIMLNGRVEMDAEDFRILVNRILTSECAEMGVDFLEEQVTFFHPSFPNPTHRLP